MNRPRQLHAEPPAKHRHRTSPASRRRISCPACAVHVVVGSGRGPPVQPDWFEYCLVRMMMHGHLLVLACVVKMLAAKGHTNQVTPWQRASIRAGQAGPVHWGCCMCPRGAAKPKGRSLLLATAEFGTTTCSLPHLVWSFAPAFPTSLLTHCTPRPPHRHQAHPLHRNHELRTYL